MQKNKIACVYTYEASQTLLIYLYKTMKQATPVLSNTTLFTSILAVGTIASVVMLSNTFADTTLSDKQTERQEMKTQIEAAIESGNYAEFATLTEGKKMAETITEENFSKLQELHILQKEVQTLREELGMPDKKQGHKGKRGQKGERTEGETEERTEKGGKRGEMRTETQNDNN